MGKSRNKTLAKKKADRYFSQYIRQRDTDHRGIGTCITCGEPKNYDELDCGHFISRRKQSTRYDERNANAQCARCNRFLGGRQYEHGKAIDLKYGAGTAEELLQLSNEIVKMSKADYEDIAEEYKDLIE